MDDDGTAIDVSDPVGVDASHRAVVVEVVPVPVAAVVAGAGIAVSIGHAAVEADVQSPVAAIKAIAAAVEAPVAGGPESAGIGRGDPGSGNPIVASGGVAPVTGRPDIVRIGWRRLGVVGQRRWRLIGLFDRILTGVDLVVICLVLLIVGVRLIRLIFRSGSGGGWLGSVLTVLIGLLLALVFNRLAWSGLRLAAVDRGHVNVRGIGAGGVCDLAGLGLFVAP